MTSVSAHAGLVMKVRFLTVEGVTSLVRYSPKLITLHLYTIIAITCVDEKYLNTLKKLIQITEWKICYWSASSYILGSYF